MYSKNNHLVDHHKEHMVSLLQVNTQRIWIIQRVLKKNMTRKAKLYQVRFKLKGVFLK